jgi:hypothetical protein
MLHFFNQILHHGGESPFGSFETLENMHGFMAMGFLL